MGSHFHLVVQTTRANLSEFMRRFNICYTGWFNYHHHTCGHLYQGRYKAFLVDADYYLLALSRYVHLNPVRVGRLQKSDYRDQWQYISRYRWSSLPGYLFEKKVVDVVDYEMILEMTGGRDAYRRFLWDGLKDGVKHPFEDVQHQAILGNGDFVALVKSKYVEKGSLREQPMYRGMVSEVIEPEVVISCVATILGIGMESIMVRSGNGLVRGIVAEMLHRYSALTQREIGGFLGGIDYTAVSMLRRRLKERIENDRAVSDRYIQVEHRLRSICEV
jgi:hypothetical protein